MKKFTITIAALLLTACGSEPKTLQISAAQYGDKWPLTVDKGTLSCEQPDRIVFTTSEGQRFGINGSASNDQLSILEITKETENLGVKFKMDTSFLIDEGMKLCNPKA